MVLQTSTPTISQKKQSSKSLGPKTLLPLRYKTLFQIFSLEG